MRISSDELVRFSLFLITSFILCIVYLVRQFHTRQSFAVFSKSHGCEAPATTTIKVSSTFLHKLRLLRKAHNGDLYNDVFRAKFQQSGATYALAGSWSVPKAFHTIDPVNVRAVLMSDEEWGVAQLRRDPIKPLAQEVILTVEGPRWLYHRKLLSRLYNTSRAKDTACLSGYVELCFQALRKAGNGNAGESLDLTPYLQDMALDMNSNFVLGVSTDIQRIRLSRSQEGAAEPQPAFPLSEWQALLEDYASNWKMVRDFVGYRTALGSKYWMADSFAYRRACSKFRRFGELFICRAEEQASRHSSNENKDQYLMQLLQQEVKDPRMVREIVLELIIASQNMTGTNLEWIFAELAAHPEEWAKVRREVLEMFGSEQEPSQTPMTWSSLLACQSLQNVISETMRCHTPIPVLPRRAKNDTILPRGGGVDGLSPVAVPKGASITCNLYLLHRREEEWGVDSWTWRPDRWIGRKRGGADFFGFGAGPRTCLGRQASLTHMSYVLARFAQHYESITAPSGVDNLTHECLPLMLPRNGVKVELKESV